MTSYKRGILLHPEELTLDWLDKMQAAGLDTLGLHPVGGPLAHESLQRAIDLHTTPASRLLRLQAAARGITVEYEAHVMRWLLPQHLFLTQPDWFRMDENGQRVDDFNLCASNWEALAYVAERTALLAKLLDTGTSQHFLWLDDVTGYRCHCPQCRGLSAADQQLRIVNAMLSGLRRSDPNATLCYIAYHDAMEVPTKVQPLDGIFLEYAPIHRDPHRPINDPDSPENAAESRTLRDLVSFFGTKNSRVLEYWMDNSMYSNWTKPPKPFTLDEEVMKRDVEFYASLGFETVTSFGCYLGPDYQQLHGQPPLQRYGDILAGK